jgi:hypothetical protein
MMGREVAVSEWEIAIWISLLFAGGLVSGVVVGMMVPQPASEWEPAESANATCYKWVENGTAQVACPSAVGAGDGVVYIDVKPCSEYEYKIDEPAPCDVEGGGA